jgi:hypothetical protein
MTQTAYTHPQQATTSPLPLNDETRRTNINISKNARFPKNMEQTPNDLGSLEPTKSFWYLLSFEWQHGCWRQTQIDESPATIKVKDADGILVELSRLETHESRKTLGAETAPDGLSDEEFERMLALTEAWREKVRASYLQKLDVWQALRSTIRMSLKYSLPVTTLSETQCNKIMDGRALIHAPATSIGAGIPDLFKIQYLDHIDIMITHGRNTPLTGQLLRATFEAFIVECGVGHTVCNPQWKPMVNATMDCWVK